MTLAIKCVGYISCHFTLCFYTHWHYTKTETRHFRPYSSGHHRQSHWPVANTI